MRSSKTTAHIFELDGALYHLDENTLAPIQDLRDVPGDKWLVTDFQEALSRVMTVEGPAKYAELLVRKRLQETGEFEEPVHILTHWKGRLGKSTTEIFFTAVPARLATYYFEELKRLPDIALVYSMYGVLWHTLKSLRSKSPAAVILRHHRFAEVVVGSSDRVYFANRSVAFDTEQAQVEALWNTVQSDIEAVERTHRLQVERILCLNWLDATATPAWPDAWLQRLEPAETIQLALGDDMQTMSWPLSLQKQSVWRSGSSGREKLLYSAKRWAPAINMGMAAAACLLTLGMIKYQHSANQLALEIEALGRQMGRQPIQVSGPAEVVDFDGQLDFISDLSRNKRAPSFQQVFNDLTPTDWNALVLNDFKVDYSSSQMRVELYGEIQAPFDQAHSGYQSLLGRLRKRGYQIEDSRFETQINSSKVVLKLVRPGL